MCVSQNPGDISNNVSGSSPVPENFLQVILFEAKGPHGGETLETPPSLHHRPPTHTQ